MLLGPPRVQAEGELSNPNPCTMTKKKHLHARVMVRMTPVLYIAAEVWNF